MLPAGAMRWFNGWVLPSVLPRLAGPTVVLRPFEHRDAPLITSAGTDPLIPLVTTVPTSGDLVDVRAFIDRQNTRLAEGVGYSFAIADTPTDEAVGQIGLWTSAVPQTGSASIGYWIGPEFRRRGYATEALRLLTIWASGLPNITRLELYVEPWNEGSWRAAQACNFRREVLLPKWQRVGGEDRDMYRYGLIPDHGENSRHPI